MASQYDIEHNIKPPSPSARQGRRIDMSTFDSHLHQILPDPETHNNPHAVANPSDVAAIFRLVQDQLGRLGETAPTDDNREFLHELVEILQEDVEHPPKELGVNQEFLDTLERVPLKRIKKDEQCRICADFFVEMEWPLVVQLPCHPVHRFCLECIGPWLLSKGTCPCCRKEVDAKRVEVEVEVDEDEEDEDVDGLYA